MDINVAAGIDSAEQGVCGVGKTTGGRLIERIGYLTN